MAGLISTPQESSAPQNCSWHYRKQRNNLAPNEQARFSGFAALAFSETRWPDLRGALRLHLGDCTGGSAIGTFSTFAGRLLRGLGRLQLQLSQGNRLCLDA